MSKFTYLGSAELVRSPNACPFHSLSPTKSKENILLEREKLVLSVCRNEVRPMYTFVRDPCPAQQKTGEKSYIKRTGHFLKVRTD